MIDSKQCEYHYLCLYTWISIIVSEGNISDIRLISGENLSSGRVEVLYDGEWGTVCDDGWDINDAHVVCRYLGFVYATAAYGNAYYGHGVGRVLLSDVACYGNESYISDCQFEAFGNHDCGHSKDAGVACRFYSNFYFATFISVIVFCPLKMCT